MNVVLEPNPRVSREVADIFRGVGNQSRVRIDAHRDLPFQLDLIHLSTNPRADFITQCLQDQIDNINLQLGKNPGPKGIDVIIGLGDGRGFAQHIAEKRGLPYIESNRDQWGIYFGLVIPPTESQKMSTAVTIEGCRLLDAKSHRARMVFMNHGVEIAASLSVFDAEMPDDLRKSKQTSPIYSLTDFRTVYRESPEEDHAEFTKARFIARERKRFTLIRQTPAPLPINPNPQAAYNSP